MYQTITKSMFHDAFRNYDRLENFSYDARDALFDYLENLEDENSKVEMDVIALCCEFNEDKIEEVLKNYNLESLKDLENKTLVVWHNKTHVLYLVF